MVLAFVEIVISLFLLRKRTSLRNLLATIAIISLNGLSMYILAAILLNSWPTYTPHIGIGLSTLILIWQILINKNQSGF